MNKLKKAMGHIKQFFSTLFGSALFSRAGNSIMVEPKRKNNPKPKRTKGRKRTISDTLDGLDSAFASLNKRDDSMSWSDKSTRNALRKLGPFVPPPDYHVRTNLLNDTKSLPSLIFVNTRSFFKGGEKLSCTYMYAKRCDKRPPECQFVNGVVYECGAAFEDEKNLFWAFFFISIRQDGSVVPIKYKYRERVSLPGGAWFTRPANGFGNIEEWAGEHNAEANQFLKQAATMCFNFWAMKDRMWRIIVKKGGVRMNFSIGTDETKHYFKDRDRSGICTQSGRLKPIAHYVSEHTRRYTSGKTTVIKEHVRGLRRFLWNGYQVIVKSPRFGGVFADSFEGAASSDEASDMVRMDDALDGLVRAEERLA